MFCKQMGYGKVNGNKWVLGGNGETYEKVGQLYEIVGIYLKKLVFMLDIYVSLGEILS